LFEIPSYVAGLIAFLTAFILMGIMFLILRTDRNKTIPSLSDLAPTASARFENPLSTSDAPYLALITLVSVELIFDALIVVSTIQGYGSIAVGTMLAVAAFLAAAILVVYRDAFMSDVFIRKPRLEIIAALSFSAHHGGEEHEGE